MIVKLFLFKRFCFFYGFSDIPILSYPILHNLVYNVLACLLLLFFRLPIDIYQTAKVSKLLLMIENGLPIEHKGKTLSEIDIDFKFADDSSLICDEGKFIFYMLCSIKMLKT